MELCRIHSCPLPNEVNQLNTFHSAPMASSNQNSMPNHNGRTPSKNHIDDIDSDNEDIEDAVGDSDSDAEEDLPLELDDGRSANKKDEMEVEHLATLERLRQTQRQDYLRVCDGECEYRRLSNYFLHIFSFQLSPLTGFSIRKRSSDRPFNERTS